MCFYSKEKEKLRPPHNPSRFVRREGAKDVTAAFLAYAHEIISRLFRFLSNRCCMLSEFKAFLCVFSFIVFAQFLASDLR